MTDGKDILASDNELKKMPFSVPEGYFDSFREKAMNTALRKEGLWRRLYPVLTLAAMFIIMVTAGTFFLKKATPSEGMSAEDYFVFSDMEIPSPEYGTYDTRIADAEISDDDIVQYLIYLGVEAENLGY